MAIAAQVVARQVNQHYVFGVLLGVVSQRLGSLHVGHGVACAARRTGYRVYVDTAVPYAAMGLGAAPQQAETPKSK